MAPELHDSDLIELRMNITANAWSQRLSKADSEGRELTIVERADLVLATLDQESLRHDWFAARKAEGRPVSRLIFDEPDRDVGVRLTSEALDMPVLWLYGEVGSDFEGITAEQVKDDLFRVNDRDPLLVRIHSIGGSALDAFAIHSLLISRKGKVTVHVDGVAASAASLIAMAGDDVIMAVGARMMIHEVHGSINAATADVFEHSATLLREQNAELYQVYMKRWKGTEEELAVAMKAETWYTPSQAIAVGLADSVSSAKSVSMQVSAHHRYKNLPSCVSIAAKAVDCPRSNVASLHLHRLG